MTNVKSLKKQLMAAIAMVVVAAIALSSATYAWFVNNAQVTATNVNVQAATAYSLLISQDNTNWGTTTKLDALTNELTPVSTIGEIAATSVELTDSTSVAVGDVRFTAGTKWENNYMTEFTEVSKDSEVKGTDDSEDIASKYFYTETVYLKAAQASNLLIDNEGIKIVWTEYGQDAASTLSLSEFMELDLEKANGDDNDNSLTEDQIAYNERLESAQSLIKTLRVGFMITQYEGGVTTGNVSTRKFYEYQLVKEYIAESNASNTTMSDAVTNTAEGITYAVQASDGTIAKIDVASGTMYNKTITDYAVTGSATALVATANQSSADVLAKMAVNEVVKCDIYVWMEGCDYDTVAANIDSFSGTGLTGLQFGFCLGEVAAAQ